MLRWLLRLLILGAILGAGALVAKRLLSQEEDWDDFDDFDESFEFQETPVEIEVPAQEGGQSPSGSDMATSSFAGSEGTGEGEAGGPGLTDVKGIGNAFESRLKAIGVKTLHDLAGANPESLNEQLDVPGGVSTLQDWISQAQKLSSGGSGSDGRSSQ